MITVRLARFGSKNKPFYRVVVTDKKNKLQGKHVEMLGFYNPITKDLNIDDKKVHEWVSIGAQLSASVKKLLSEKTSKK